MRFELSAPDSLREVKLWQYQKYMAIEEPTQKDMVKIFLNIPDSLVDRIPYKDVERVTAIITEMFQQEPKLSKSFEMEGVEYGFIPNLDDMSYGEYVDLVSFSQGFENMHKAMAVMYRPVTKRKKDKYLIEEYKGANEYSNVMKGAPLDVVFGSLVFFFDLGSELLRAIPNFMKGQMMGDSELMEAFSKSGVSITSLERLPLEWESHFTRLRKEMYMSA